MLQGDTDITIPMDVPPGRREVAVNKSLENGGLGISIKGRSRSFAHLNKNIKQDMPGNIPYM